MSAAKPMSDTYRLWNYATQSGAPWGCCTPRQSRRVKHKRNRAERRRTTVTRAELAP